LQSTEQATTLTEADQGGDKTSATPSLLLTRAEVASLILAFILVAWIVYAAVFIYLTSVVAGGVRYFLLFDDEMISMRYAANLAHGYGLVWNPHGARVEGFTNPLWVLIMTVLHLLPVSLAKMSLLVQILGAALRFATLLIVWRLALAMSRNSKAVALCAVFFTAFYYPLNDWSLRGSEVALLAPMLTLAAWLAIRTMSGAPSGWLWPLLAATTLVRLDMTVSVVTILALVAWADPPRRREHLLYGGGFLLLLLSAQLLAACWYFGNPLPNTYYLKMTGYPTWPRIEQGLRTARHFLMHLDPVLLGLVAAVIWLKREAKCALLGAVFVGQVAYSIYVGGDAWEQFGGANRYVVVAMPIFIILVALALEMTATALSSIRGAAQNSATKWIAGGVFGLMAAASAVALGTFAVDNINSVISWRQTLLLDRPPEYEEHRGQVELALMTDRLTDRGGSIAVVWAGVLPYFANRTAIDLLGKNDATVAHEPMRRDLAFCPGHMKWDYAYSVGVLKPDVVVETWYPSDEDLQRVFGPSYRLAYINGHRWYFRNDSPHVRWAEVERLRDLAR
jgi:arabinofuranosyltransferase